MIEKKNSKTFTLTSHTKQNIIQVESRKKEQKNKKKILNFMMHGYIKLSSKINSDNLVNKKLQ